MQSTTPQYDTKENDDPSYTYECFTKYLLPEVSIHAFLLNR